MLARRLSLITVTVASAVLLAGCVPTGEATPTPTASASSSASATPSPTDEPSTEPTAAPGAESEPVTIGCSDLISLDDMYEFDPNFSLLTSFTPPSGSAAAEAVADQGIACRWVHNTSGVTIDISVAHLLDSALSTKKSQVQSSSTSVPTYDSEGYFSTAGSVGTAQVFTGPYWVTVTSEAFFEAGDAATLVNDADDSLN